MNTVGSPFFAYRQDCLFAEELPLAAIAQHYGTPTYVYSRAALTANLREFQDVLASHPAGADSLVCYAVKANSNLAILNLFARLGAGFDIVSGGELQRVLAAGADAGKVVFSGVGKTEAEMELALNAGILCFNVESAAELERLNAVAGRLGKQAPISLRVNPDVDPKTHPYISTGLKTAKFGVPIDQALTLYEKAAALPHLQVEGIDCHIGSQLLDPSPFVEALERVLKLLDALTARNIPIHHLDLGGGLGIRYRQEDTQPSVDSYLRPLLDKLQGRGLKIILEPGRRLVGNAGLLLTKVEFLKPGEGKNFAVIDAAMNDLMRPALYEAWHEIQEVEPKPGSEPVVYDVVGPVCETGDFLGQDRALVVAPGDLLAVMSAGAYGMAMSSNYNTRPRAAEVMVDGDQMHCIRRRETVAELYALEQKLPG
ncbi:diaminopimelate decarboxylase [Azovibrio restrictus]|uniref:diaminopimelate decarboxylase n=1 Tax=Azovibrio restrictus TaxID=146938 RepID=UPI0026EC87AC|nr:diaminopimelate decarboxylase [Azovibrio restrictus]